MRFTFFRLAPLWATLSVSGPLHAAASLLVDDAETTPEGTCQLESWARDHASHQEFTTAPACTLGGTELSLGLSHLRGAGASPWSVGLKRSVQRWRAERVQLAASIETGGDVRSGGARGWATTLPLTIALADQGRVVAHLNAGWSHSRHERGTTLGLGIETQLSSTWSLLAEQWQDAARHRSHQIGLRRRMQGDASLDFLAGHRGGDGHARWFTVGFNFPLAR